MMWLIASDVSGDEVRTTRKVPVMSELSGLVHYRKMVKHSATLVQCLPNQNVPEALLQHTPWTDASQSKWYTQPSVNIYRRPPNTLSQNISGSSRPNIWPVIFCIEFISVRPNETLKLTFRFAVLPESATCELNFESCVFHELTFSPKKIVVVEYVKYRTPPPLLSKYKTKHGSTERLEERCY